VDFGAETLSYEDYYDETRDRYDKAFLMMITYQCDALVDKFNVTPLIIGLVGPISLRYMALSLVVMTMIGLIKPFVNPNFNLKMVEMF